ncbi:mitochondrial coenzyme A transporter SLC25A42 [Belonocnema kinseyi]|uniref:mitochondrial coenzyme A transporter SLC25A42 n=1 Tax=Belonocnema kinseyi TaxID=2817044 RepID=UPI00143DF72A|nr:mitochondrial coenzyme A transporter SLC25A42 [Belonocnema kinseyi]XP_033208798.1 mitochondrial coenzyme A transporter SLC25A42 [Belonocnema kinseyi]XP_033208799.1 mitochondrial coenzyme A transporter SLC25A42 [Belonocnema kinseyi]XP_033208800.1 mitochondrial coenzyme A transporter SLC25A42 [Belonocnema kinseyi]
MSGHAAAGGVEGSQAVLERIQVTVLPSTKTVPINPAASSDPEMRVETPLVKDENNGISNTQRVWTSLVAGAIAGAIAKTVIAPLDRTKINFQISKKPYSAKAATDFLVNSYQKDGLISLWRGNSATMVRIVPYAAIQFTSHEQWKRLLHVDSPETVTSGTKFLAGSLAGVTSQGLTYPLDLARARMAVTDKDEYKTLRQVFARIYRHEGILSFYRGFPATILGVIPYAGFSFFTFDTLKDLLAVYTVNSPGLTAMAALACGAAAGMVGQTSSYPFDIVRRRMQTSAVKGQHYRTVIKTTRQIYAEEGIMAFYKGLSMNWVKGPVAVGISFATYDVLKDTMRKVIR